MSSKVIFPETQSNSAPSTSINLPARVTEKRLRSLRWLTPLLLSVFVFLVEGFEPLIQSAYQDEDLTLIPEIFFFGVVGPIAVFFVLSWVLRQWQLRRQDAEALQQLYVEATEARKELARLTAERTRLLRRQVKIHEQERRRIATELHDELGSLLTRLNTNLGLFRDKLFTSPDELKISLEEAQALVTQTLEYAHGIYANLRPPLLDKLGLAAALRAEARQRLSTHNVQWGLHTEGDLNHLPDDVSMAAFRITQEALSNVIRHARAQNVEISLVRKKDILHLTVSDDGIGFQPSANRSDYQSLGLIGMRERAQAICGQFQVVTNPQSGTLIKATLPLNGVESV